MQSPIYWVRRANQDARYRAASEKAAERRVARQNDAARLFNERFGRIHRQYMTYMTGLGQLEATPTQVSKLSESVDEYTALKTWIDENIDAAGQRELGRLATLAKNVIQRAAKLKGDLVEWDAGSKVLTVADEILQLG